MSENVVVIVRAFLDQSRDVSVRRTLLCQRVYFVLNVQVSVRLVIHALEFRVTAITTVKCANSDISYYNAVYFQQNIHGCCEFRELQLNFVSVNDENPVCLTEVRINWHFRRRYKSMSPILLCELGYFLIRCCLLPTEYSQLP